MAWLKRRAAAAAGPVYEEVSTPQGRTAHKRRPGATRVLCGWPAPEWVKAPAFLAPCRMCETEAEISAMEAMT